MYIVQGTVQRILRLTLMYKRILRLITLMYIVQGTVQKILRLTLM